MVNQTTRFSRDEFARRGDEIYEQDIRRHVEPTHAGQFVAIDIDSGAYELDDDDFTATERLLAKAPSAQIWLLRVGEQSTYRLGGGRVVTRGASPS